MIRRIGIPFLIIMLTSCTTITPPSAPYVQIPWKDRQIALSHLQHWQISGKIAVQTAKESGSASVDWTQNQNNFTLSLLGPLGTNGLRLSGQPGKVTLEMADGKHFTASNAEQLLAERWGFHLPVSNLKYWIRGLPAPGIPSNNQFDTSGRLSELMQQGWRVRFLSYTHVGTTDLPAKIFINSPDLTVKIIIYRWNAN